MKKEMVVEANNRLIVLVDKLKEKYDTDHLDTLQVCMYCILVGLRTAYSEAPEDHIEALKKYLHESIDFTFEKQDTEEDKDVKKLLKEILTEMRK